MNTEDATKAVGYLVGGTTGWNDEAVVIYVAELKQLSDPQALNAAIMHLVQTWREARRPPVATVLDAYRAELSKRQPAPKQLNAGGQTVSVAEGIEIARKAYEQECQRLGREPNLNKFSRMAATLQ